MKKRESIIKICNMICAVLMAALVVLQFVPFWYSVGGVFKTSEEYLAWSETYEPAAPATQAPETEAETEAATVATTEAATEAATEGATEAATEPAATEAATEPAATEAATEPAATEAATEPAATEAATEPAATEGATEAATEPAATEGATEAATEPAATEAATEPAPTEKKQTNTNKRPEATEPTEIEVKKLSIAGSVWNTTKIKNAPQLMFHVVVLLVGGVGVFFCLTKRKGALNFVWPMLVGVLATLGYFTNPDAQTGMNWMVHGIISAAILVPAAVLAVMWLRNVVDFFTKREN